VLLPQLEEIQNNGIQLGTVLQDGAPKMYNYIENLPYAEG